METILIADDERSVRNVFKSIFEAEGYAVTLARDGAEAVRLFDAKRPDLVLLDVMMPKMNGLAACAEIRRLDALVPIMFFTAMPSEISLVRGLGMGADDYIDKSRTPDEFVARVKAAFRRRLAAASAERPREVILLGAVTVDLSKMSVEKKGEPSMALTRTEAIILGALNEQRGRYVNCESLLARIYGDDFRGDTSRIRSYISSLKKKLGPAGDMIANNYRSGYCLIK